MAGMFDQSPEEALSDKASATEDLFAGSPPALPVDNFASSPKDVLGVRGGGDLSEAPLLEATYEPGTVEEEASAKQTVELFNEAPTFLGEGFRHSAGGFLQKIGAAKGGPAVMRVLSNGQKSDMAETGVELADTALENLRSARERVEEKTGALTWGNERVLETMQSLGISLPSGVLAVATSGSSAALAPLALFSFGQSYDNARRAGLKTDAERTAYASLQTGFEVGGEILPLKVIQKAGVGPFTKWLADYFLKDLAGEELTTVAQHVTDWAMLPGNESKTVKDLLAELPPEMVNTAAVTALMAGTQGPVLHGVGKGMDLYMREKRVKQAERLLEDLDKVFYNMPMLNPMDPSMPPAVREQVTDLMKAHKQLTEELRPFLPEGEDVLLEEDEIAGTYKAVRGEMDTDYQKVKDVPVRSSNPALTAKTLAEAVHTPGVYMTSFQYDNQSMSKGEREAAAILEKAAKKVEQMTQELVREVLPDATVIIADGSLNRRLTGWQEQLGPLEVFENTANNGHMLYWHMLRDDGSSRPVVMMELNPVRMLTKLDKGQFGPALHGFLRRLVSHEIGHGVWFRHVFSLPQPVQEALRNEWRSHIQRVYSNEMTVQEFMDKMTGPSRAEMVRTQAERLKVPLNSSARQFFKKAAVRMNNPKMWLQYVPGFVEYSAEQMVRTNLKDGVLADPALGPWRKQFKTAMERVMYHRRWKDKSLKGYENFVRTLAAQGRLKQALREELARVGRLKMPPNDTPKIVSSRWARAFKVAGKGSSGSDVMEDAGLTPEGMEAEQIRFGTVHKYGLTLLQIAEQNKDTPELQQYVELMREMHRVIGTWARRNNERMQQSKDLGRDRVDGVYKLLMTESSLGVTIMPGSPEWVEVFGNKDYRLDAEQEQFYLDIRRDFVDFLQGWKALAEAEAQSELGQQPEKLAARMKSIRDSFGSMLSKPYFPLSRFGKFFYVAVATKDGYVKGDYFRKGDVLWREHFYTKHEREEAAAAFKQKFTGEPVNVSVDEMEDFATPFVGLPPQLFQYMEKQLGLTDSQSKRLREMRLEWLPAQSFRKHFKQRQGIGGWSEDGERQYANYFFFGANSLAKSQYRLPLQKTIAALQNRAKQMQVDVQDFDATKHTKLSAWMSRHLQYVMNPGEEYVWARQTGFLMYLGFNVKSAMVNATQPVLVTYPHLAAIYGDKAAMKELAKAYKDVPARWRKDPQDVYQPELMEAISRGKDEGYLDESLVSHIAGLAEGSFMTRVMPGTRAGQKWQSFNYAAAYMFAKVEGINREVAFVAAWRLEYAKSGDSMAAYKAARESVEKTQYEYARWNRPAVFRNKGAVIFLFKMYLQNTLYFALGGDKGWWRFWMIMMLFGGLEGLPFAENIFDLVDGMLTVSKRVLGVKNPKTDLRKEMREWLEYTVPHSADLAMRGISRNTFGLGYLNTWMNWPIPQLDLSGSLSMGRVIPGTDLLKALSTGANPASLLYIERETLGPVVGYPIGLMQAVFDNNPDTFKRWGNVAPTAVKAVWQAWDIAQKGGPTTRTGAVKERFNLNDPVHRAELAMMALAFPSTRVNRENERMRLIAEHVDYYKARREIVLGNYFHAVKSKSREGIADAMDSVKEFNRTKPDKLPGIASKDLRASVQQRMKGVHREEVLGVRDAKKAGYAKELSKGYGGFNHSPQPSAVAPEADDLFAGEPPK